MVAGVQSNEHMSWYFTSKYVYNMAQLKFTHIYTRPSMTTVTAAGWSGLVNDVHATTYETVGEIVPKGGKVGRLMQKRGLLSASGAVAGAVIQNSRAVIDVALATDTDFYAGTAAGVRMDATNTQGGVRANTLINVVPATDAEGVSQLFDTTITHAYVADLAGNGGAAMLANAANAAQV